MRNTLGFALLAKGNRVDAIAAFNESLKRRESTSAYFGLASAYAGDKRLPEARANIDKALAIEPANTQFQQLQARLK